MRTGRTAVAACVALAAAAAGESSSARRNLRRRSAHDVDVPLRGTAGREQPRALQEQPEQPNEDTGEELFGPDPLYNDRDPYDSNREELLGDTEQLLAMELTDPPATSASAPAGAPSPGPPYAQGDGAAAHKPVLPPPADDANDSDYDSPYPWGRDNDDPPGGYNPWGRPSSHNNSTRPTRPLPPEEDTDFKEFIAFVGWYAFLILCCLLPTFCAYYRRRRNARAMRDNFLSIQSRLAEIERRRGEEGARGAEGVEVGMEGVLGEMEREGRERDWELIESIFGPIRGSADPSEQGRQRRLMMAQLLPNGAELLGSMSVLVERERRRRAERGRRLVAALKGTSFAVRECHLIEKGGTPEGFDGAEGGDGEMGDIEMGPLAIAEDELNVAAEGLDQSDQSEVPKCTEEKTGGASHGDSDGSGAEALSAVASPRDDGASDSGDADNSQSAAVGETDDAAPTAPPNNPITSLYEVDDPYEDDDDNQYTALCLPCPDQSNSATGETTPQPQQRLVPATCAVCLLQYSPGCHATWSSNPECTHVFHRDCILMWLLKKEEPLCPCCRRDFVSESALNGEFGEAETVDELGGAIGGATTALAREATGEAPARQPPQDLPSSARWIFPPAREL